MKLTRKSLKESDFHWHNEIDNTELTVFSNDSINGFTPPFALLFNGGFKYYRTFEALKSSVKRFVEKYNLVEGKLVDTVS